MPPSLQNLIINHKVWNMSYMPPIFSCPKLAPIFHQWAVLDFYKWKGHGQLLFCQILELRGVRICNFEVRWAVEAPNGPRTWHLERGKRGQYSQTLLYLGCEYVAVFKLIAKFDWREDPVLVNMCELAATWDSSNQRWNSLRSWEQTIDWRRDKGTMWCQQIQRWRSQSNRFKDARPCLKPFR